MTYDAHTNENIKLHLRAICQTAVRVWILMGEEGGDLENRLGEIAESIIDTYELGESVLTEYQSTIKGAKELKLQPKKKLTVTEAENTREMIFALCDTLTDPSTIMKYVRTSCELVDIWDNRKKFK